MDGIVVGFHQWSAVAYRPLCRKIVFSLANGSPTRLVPTWFARILGIAAVASDRIWSLSDYVWRTFSLLRPKSHRYYQALSNENDAFCYGIRKGFYTVIWKTRRRSLERVRQNLVDRNVFCTHFVYWKSLGGIYVFIGHSYGPWRIQNCRTSGTVLVRYLDIRIVDTTH